MRIFLGVKPLTEVRLRRSRRAEAGILRILHDTRSAPMNDDNLQMDLMSGIAAFESKHFQKALTLLSPLADSGHPEAQYRFAIMLQNGLGHVKNEAQALRWMRAAAEQGMALAQHGLGFMYLHGECTAKNEAEAADWFRRAAEQGLAGSAMTLGLMYEQGLGVEKNQAEAKRYYELAERASQ